jgi:hypothetical protein
LPRLNAVASLSPDERSARARKAAQASATKRREATRERDEEISIVYRRLTGRASKEEEFQAIRVMTRWGRGVNLPEGVGVLRFLAQATGLTKRRIWGIIKKPSNRM